MAPDSLAVQKRREDAARSLWEWLDRLVWTLRAVTFEDATTYRHGVAEAMNCTLCESCLTIRSVVSVCFGDEPCRKCGHVPEVKMTPREIRACIGAVRK